MQPDHTTLSAQLANTEAYLAADPGNAPLLARAIDLCLELGDPARALPHADAASAAMPGDPFLAYRHGIVLMALREWGTARAILAPLAARERDVNLATSAATCAMMQNDAGAVLATLAPFEADPGLPGAAVILLVRAHHHSADLERALAVVSAHRERMLGDAAFCGAAALACLDAEQLDEAAAFSTAARAAAAAQGGSTLEADVTSATIALAHTDPDTAAAGFETVLAAHPNEGRSWSGLGLANLLRRDLPAAGPQLEQAVQLMPGHIGSWHALGWCRIFEGDYAAARQAFETALDLDRNFAESHGGLAVVAALTGQREEAADAAQRALGLDRTSLAARYAQMVLAGDTLDPDRFRTLALRLLRGHRTPGGESLADVALRSADNPPDAR
jgi:tetratricopeptide (TPR) repeat protein